MIIYKYPLRLRDTEVALPRGAEILKVAMQGGELMLWALVDPDEDVIMRRWFVVVPTGYGSVFKCDKHIETVLDGDFVWHIFERL